MKLRYLILILMVLANVTVRAQTFRPELRAFWADGFNEGYKTPEQIDTLLQRLHEAHCNAVFAQMRKGGDAYYASHYEPWATDDAQHFDALACLIDKAHRMQPRIAVHAWINTCAVGTGTKHPGFHIAQLHPEWMSVNARGRADDGEVRKIDPGNPDAADWTFRLYLDVVRHYDVDGIHFDFVRYGSPRWGYNPVSVQRFRARSATGSAATSLPAYNDPTWNQWRRDQVTNLVRKVYAHAAAIKPNVVVSAATIAWGNGPHNEMEWQEKSAAMNKVFQDWRSWLQEGCIDLACPMTYFGGKHGLEYERTWSAWTKAHQYGRAAAIAVGNWQLLPTQTLAQMQIARVPDAQGHTPYGVMLYSYAGTNLGVKPGKPGLHELELQPDFYALLSRPSAYSSLPPFAADVVLPPMSWKTQPTKGVLKGFVRDSNLQAADGAQVTIRSTRSGRHWTRSADGTGFYAFVDLPPDTYKVQASTRKLDEIPVTELQQVSVQSGRVATCHIDMPSSKTEAAMPASASGETELSNSVQVVIQQAQSAPPVAAPAVQTTGSAQATGKTRLRNVTVVLGTDTFPGNLYVRDGNAKTDLCLRIRLHQPPLLPFQPGDIVDILGDPKMLDGEPCLDNANACLNDITLETPSASLPLLPLPALLNPSPAGHGFARTRGRVTQYDADSFTLASEDAKSEGARLRVMLAGRKGFGVEAGGWTALRPAIGSLMEVTGLVTAGTRTANGVSEPRLLPRSSADIVQIAPPPPARLASRMLQAVAALIALLLLALWSGRKRQRQPLQRRTDTPLSKTPDA